MFSLSAERMRWVTVSRRLVAIRLPHDRYLPAHLPTNSINAPSTSYYDRQYTYKKGMTMHTFG